MRPGPFRPLWMIGLALLLIAGIGGALPARADTSVRGFIAQVSPSNNALTVDTGKGNVTFSVGPFTWITKDSIDCALTNLRVGDKVRASVFTDNGQYSALRVDAQSKGRQKTIKGALVNLSPGTWSFKVDQRGKDGEDVTNVFYDSTTLFSYNGSPAKPADLKVGDNVTVLTLVQPNGAYLANRVDISANQSKQTVLVFGFMKSVSGQTLVLQSWKDGSEEFIATDTARMMTRNKQNVTLGDLIRGDRVFVVGTRNFAGGVDAQMITVLSPNVRFTGTIASIDGSNRRVVLKPFDPQAAPIPLHLLPASLMVVNGRDVELSEIRVGDQATVTCIVQTDVPWGVTSLEIVRLSDDGSGGGSSGGGSGDSSGKLNKKKGWTD